MTKCSVVVIGAGTVGLVTALGLARNGVEVAVLERDTDVGTAPRDMVYHWSILPTLADLGILQPMLDAGLRCDRYSMKVLATGETVYLDMDVLGDITSTPFNVHVPQREMTDVLMAALAERPHATVQRGVDVREISQDADGVTITADAAGEAREYRSQWVVGADGSHSVVRRAVGLSFGGTTWHERMVSADLRFDMSTLGHSCASTQLDPEYGATIAKVDVSGLWRYTIAESRMLPDDRIQERALNAIRHALPDGADPGLVRMSPYRIHQRSADSYRVGRALLVGDAAHLTTPSLALGMLSGLCDAKLLIEGLSAVVLDGAAAEVLDEYSISRHQNFRDVTSPRSSERMELVFAPRSTARLDERMAAYRQAAVDRDERRKFFEPDLECASPSLFGTRRAAG